MRMSAWEHETYMALGGNRWLRAFLKQKRVEMVKEAHQKLPPLFKETK